MRILSSEDNLLSIIVFARSLTVIPALEQLRQNFFVVHMQGPLDILCLFCGCLS